MPALSREEPLPGLVVRDLGRLSGDTLIYGGPYSNLEATEALFDAADRIGIPPERRLCTGDIVAYCADPVATAECVALRGGPIVAGNCERQLADVAEDCGCGFDEGSACDLLSKGWYPYALKAIAGRTDIRDEFAACPDVVTFEHGGRRIAMIHGGLTDIARFVWPVSSDADFREEILAIEREIGPMDMVLAGHSGLPFARQIDNVLWVNAGVIGMPPNDGKPETRFLVLSRSGHRFEHLSYDHETAAAKMRKAGLVQGYDDALITGVWPSEDILPPSLRRDAQGGGGLRQVL